MGDIVNLKQFRKAVERRARERVASENRTRFGQTRQEREALRRETEKSVKDLDDKRIE